MTNSVQHRCWTFGLSLRPATAALTIAIAFALSVFAQSAHAQTFKVIYDFTGGADGANPYA